MCAHTLYKNTFIKTMAHLLNSQYYVCTYSLQRYKQNYQSYMCTYSLQQHKHNQKSLLFKITSVTCVKYLYNNKKYKQENIVTKMPSHTCVPPTHYYNININKKACCQKFHYYMCAYPLQKYKHKKDSSRQNPQSYKRKYPLQQQKH